MRLILQFFLNFAGKYLYLINSKLYFRSTYILTIPMEKQLEPRIRQFYRGGEEWQNQKMDWSPLVYVETTSLHVEF